MMHPVSTKVPPQAALEQVASLWKRRARRMGITVSDKLFVNRCQMPDYQMFHMIEPGHGMVACIIERDSGFEFFGRPVAMHKARQDILRWLEGMQDAFVTNDFRHDRIIVHWMYEARYILPKRVNGVRVLVKEHCESSPRFKTFKRRSPNIGIRVRFPVGDRRFAIGTLSEPDVTSTHYAYLTWREAERVFEGEWGVDAKPKSGHVTPRDAGALSALLSSIRIPAMGTVIVNDKDLVLLRLVAEIM